MKDISQRLRPGLALVKAMGLGEDTRRKLTFLGTKKWKEFLVWGLEAQ